MVFIGGGGGRERTALVMMLSIMYRQPANAVKMTKLDTTIPLHRRLY